MKRIHEMKGCEHRVCGDPECLECEVVQRERNDNTDRSACSAPAFGGSAFLSHVHHAYAQTDGTYAWPNSRDGDMLRQAKREIEALMAQNNRI
jgi:hypothetical protein